MRGNLRKLGNADAVALGQNDRAKYRVLELADIARPWEGRQQPQGVRCDVTNPLAFFRCKQRQKVAGQRRDIVRTLAQRRHRDRKYVQTIKQVLAETALLYVGDKIAIGRGNEPNVDFHRLARADRFDLAFLN